MCEKFLLIIKSLSEERIFIFCRLGDARKFSGVCCCKMQNVWSVILSWSVVAVGYDDTGTTMMEKDSIEMLDLCKNIPKHRNNQNLLFYFHNTCVLCPIYALVSEWVSERDVLVIELSYCNNKPSTLSLSLYECDANVCLIHVENFVFTFSLRIS